MAPLQLAVYWRLALIFFFMAFLFFLDIFAVSRATSSCNNVPGELPAGSRTGGEVSSSAHTQNWTTWEVREVMNGSLIQGTLCMDPVVLSYSVEWSLPRYRIWPPALLSFSFSLGMMALAPLAYLTHSWTQLHLALAIPQILCLPLYYSIPESPSWLLLMRRTETLEEYRRRSPEDKHCLDLGKDLQHVHLDTDTPEKVTDTPEKVTDTPEKVTDTPEEVTDTPEKVTDTPEKVTDTPEKVADTPEKVTDTPEKVADTPEKVTDTPDKVTDTPEKVTDTPEEVTDTPEKVTDTLEKVTDTPEKVTDTETQEEHTLSHCGHMRSPTILLRLIIMSYIGLASALTYYGICLNVGRFGVDVFLAQFFSGLSEAPCLLKCVGLVCLCYRVGCILNVMVSPRGETIPLAAMILYGSGPIIGAGLCLFLPETSGVPLPDSLEDCDKQPSLRLPTLPSPWSSEGAQRTPQADKACPFLGDTEPEKPSHNSTDKHCTYSLTHTTNTHML
ncbi:unnamed protein product [Coregonus sp. 'balchen']|nr:unnamed protein product [Coregonus sp. 'balchen']